jgi:uncharacterized membrane protein (UPF0127 family)
MKIMMNVAVAGVVALACLFFVNKAMAELRVEKLTIVSGKDGAKHDFDVEIADTPNSREIGLMMRQKMDPDHGMLFEMDQNAVTAFWMKNTLIPLDMLFVGADGTIKTVHANAIPQDLTAISSGVPVTGVIELNGGRAAALGILPGDKVVHAYFKSDKK